MAYFTKINDARRFEVIDPENRYFGHVVAVYDESRSHKTVAPIGTQPGSDEIQFVGEPIAVFEDELREIA